MMPANHSRVRIRPLRKCDDHAIGEFFRHLSLRTRYLRFSATMRDLPDSLLQLIMSADQSRRLALVAESDIGDGAELVGLSECVAIDDHTAEVGLVVRDVWQGQGLGTVLATRTLLAAEAVGFDQFLAHVLLENVGTMRLLDRVGVVRSKKTRRGLSEVTFVRRSL